MLVSSVSINASEADNYEAAQSTDVAVTYYVPQINQQDQIVVDFPENR